MKPQKYLVSILICLLLFSSIILGCDASSDEAKENIENVKETFIKRCNDRLIQNGSPLRIGSSDFKLEEITTEEMWAKLKWQLFRVVGSEKIDSQTFLFKNGEIVSVGNGFGGFGICSFRISDIDENGKYELVYSYYWGSGISRAQVGFWENGTNIIAEEFQYLGNLQIEKVDEHTVVLKDGAYTNGYLGKVLHSKNENKPKLIIQLSDNLPQEIKDKLFSGFNF